MSKNKNKWILKIVIVGGPFFVLAGGILYLLVFTPNFRIEKVSVEGATEVSAQSIEETVLSILHEKIFNRIPKNNPVLLPNARITANIINKFPEIKSVNLIQKPLEHNLIIRIEERKPSAIWCRVSPKIDELSATSSEIIAKDVQTGLFSAENCFFIDEQGFAFKDAPILSGGVVPTVYDETPQELVLKGTVFNPETLKFILEVKKELGAVNLNLTDFVIKSQSAGDLEILAPDNWRIFFSLNDSATSQANALKRVLAEEIKGKRSQLEYVDLRVPDRVYYKYRQ